MDIDTTHRPTCETCPWRDQFPGAPVVNLGGDNHGEVTHEIVHICRGGPPNEANRYYWPRVRPEEDWCRHHPERKP